MSLFCIPNALQIDMDDMGWFCGKDERAEGGPSRTGIPRRHAVADYTAVNELGRRLGMKINCAFVIGEWDPDNRLASIPYLSRYGDAWDNASHLDRDLLRACVDEVNRSEYINLCVHGLLHGYYKPGVDWHDTSDFYYRVNKELLMTPEDEVRRRLDAFFGLLRDHGVKKRVNTFIPPSFAYRFDELSHILVDYGIEYVGTIFGTMASAGTPPTAPIDIEPCGIVTYDRHHNPLPWDAFGGEWEELPPLFGLIGVHWPNFLHADPERNLETVDRAEAYFRRSAAQFGTILSRDVAFYASQELYKRFAAVEETGDTLSVDLSALPKTHGVKDRFYVSAKGEITSAEGCSASVYEKMSDFVTYEIIPSESRVILRA